VGKYNESESLAGEIPYIYKTRSTFFSPKAINSKTNLSIFTLTPTPIHQLQVERDACFWLSSPTGFAPAKAQLYSRLKYGDATATRAIGQGLFDHLQASSFWPVLMENKEDILLSASAFGSVPTAAYWMAEELGMHLSKAGLSVEKTRFLRSGGFECHNYSRMGLKARKAALAQRDIWLDPKTATAGKTLLVLDDLRSTGAHEAMLLEAIQTHTDLHRVVFLYWVGFSPRLAQSAPETEDSLNHSQVAGLTDLVGLFETSPAPPLINARLVRFLLKHGRQLAFHLPRFSREFLQMVEAAATSNDGYAWREAYSEGYQVLVSYLETEKQ